MGYGEPVEDFLFLLRADALVLEQEVEEWRLVKEERTKKQLLDIVKIFSKSKRFQG